MSAAAHQALLHVVAGALIDDHGRVLLAQRPPGKHLAGCWEFPGGKREPGESSAAALRRELHEELGIEAVDADATPLIRVPWQYAGKSLLLEAWRVRHWWGTPQSREGQALRWQAVGHVDAQTLAPADRPILNALRLPPQYPITPDADPADAAHAQAMLQTALRRGQTLLQLRLPSWPTAAVRDLAARCQQQLRASGAQLLLNGDIEGARQLGHGIGVHLRAAQLRQLDARPLPPGQWVGASCHDAGELRLAQALGADFAVLAPVAATASHPGAAAMGWPQFTACVENAALPVYALGGMTPADLGRAHAAGGQGVAGIGAFWPR